MASGSSRDIRWLLALLLAVSTGCSLAPKSFKGINKPEPLVRARAIPMGRKLPDEKVVPQLLNSLDDRDQVVRMAAYEELKKRSGQDFGFVPYADTEDRRPAISRWRDWWSSNQIKMPRLRRRDRRPQTIEP